MTLLEENIKLKHKLNNLKNNPEKLYFYTDFNHIHARKNALQKKYQSKILFLEKLLIDKHWENIFDTFKIFFITSNPIIDLNKTKNYIKKITTQYDKEFISGSLYNFEINVKEESKTSDPEIKPILLKFHSHSLIFINKKIHKKNMTKTTMITHFFQKSIMSDKQKVQVDCVTTHHYLLYCIRYIMGLKKCKIKKKNAIKDRIWRKQIGILDYYLKIPNLKRKPINLKNADSQKELLLLEHIQGIISNLKLTQTYTLTFN